MMKNLKILFSSLVLLCVAATIVSVQSWDMFFDKGKECYEQGNYEGAIKNLELYLKYETEGPKSKASKRLSDAKAKRAGQPTNSQTPQTYVENALGLNMKMIYVEGGTFTMGASEYDSEAFDSERPAHQVTLSPFYIAEFEVTQSQWEKVMATTVYQQRDKANTSLPMRGVGDNYPMYYVNWKEANAFCEELTELTGRTYMLPTEAQWEFAARGGNKGKNSDNKYSGSYSVDAVAWYTSNSYSTTHPVGQKRANQLGIYDMSGNVCEWCRDWYGSYPSGSQANPTGPSDIELLREIELRREIELLSDIELRREIELLSDIGLRVLRGGNWSAGAGSCRVSDRYGHYASSRSDYYGGIGFRVVCLP